jgi:Cap4 SAVED domain
MDLAHIAYPAPPPPFLQLVFHELTAHSAIDALCAGYEDGSWRRDQFAEHVMEWLPEFAMSADELASFSPGTAVRTIKRAAKLVYQSDKYQKRGEFGEILLHIAMRQVYKSIPAISKIYFKDSVNSTVKGFDAVHVVGTEGTLELWLGEVKFYADSKRAIADIASEIIAHLGTQYLKNEFLVLGNKIGPSSPHYATLKKLLDQNTSLDEVFKSICVPALITYDSSAIKSNEFFDDNYKAQLALELRDVHKRFTTALPKDKLQVKVHLFAVPLRSKSELVDALDTELKKLQ